ncbi:proteasome regulatory particle base subunit rpn10 [Exophiala dermatitidis]|uniref:26S proteasome regulatory subunit N10 n=1 Tax=Exophiala dermatitidis (strain ATCC 34100 / CBS 525.76 / NIH/UT8656) TaxID=858893 RepID=H6C5G1_EXODN
MVLEATMIVVDNSEASRNGDYLPNRFSAQSEAVSLIFNAKTSANPESAVGLMSMAGTGPTVLTTPTTNYGALLSGLHDTKIKGHIRLGTAISVAMLALKHRANKSQRQRVVVLICSELDPKFGDKNDTEKELVKLAKKCKKNNVSVDFVAFGDALESNTKSILEKFIEAVGGSSGEGNHLAVIPPGPGLLSDSLITTPIINMGGDAGHGGSGMEGVETGGGEGAGGAAGFEFGVDPSADPELAMALRMSMEEEQNRLERERRAREEQERQAGDRMETITEEGQGQQQQQQQSTNGEAQGNSTDSKQPTVEDDKKE